MSLQDAPERYWDYAVEYAVELINHWTVRDFYTLGEEFMYVALVQKVDKKSKRLKFDIGNHLHNCMSPY
jgi:hypothetical protein